MDSVVVDRVKLDSDSVASSNQITYSIVKLVSPIPITPNPSTPTQTSRPPFRTLSATSSPRISSHPWQNAHPCDTGHSTGSPTSAFNIRHILASPTPSRASIVFYYQLPNIWKVYLVPDFYGTVVTSYSRRISAHSTPHLHFTDFYLPASLSFSR